MTIRPASNSPILKDGNLKPGTYKTQNIYTETYLDIEGLKDSPLSVTAYPVAWRVEIVDDVKHRGFEYVRSELDIIRHTGAVH
ncbi:hypothetical protein BDM02DRAFT_3273603 [Thelephora ganbajun]|uniref:Uncharacterized protein n=1 Tax=Thelephora ganbajun TaxID=370292 RepID=A0ACB6YXQ1_THEGA|nr:hypothetical protein BDM02DRAFT_3273603 [Thelephora ganbajun]